MEQLLAERLAGELKIDVTQVVREYWEVLFLKGLLESTIGNELLFKGGTALRLAYGSPRFSEDLDFGLEKDILAGKLDEVTRRLVSPFREAVVTDVAEKRWTYLSEIRISEGYLPQSFRVKLEISRRAVSRYQTELRLITSPSTPLQVLGRVATLDQLYRDKLACVKGRDAAKDIFDLWFIAQKLRIPYSPPETSISPQTLRRDLGKYLPAGYRNVIKDLL